MLHSQSQAQSLGGAAVTGMENSGMKGAGAFELDD
jgi:hypothetical protein